MSGFGAGDVFPSWEQLLSEAHSPTGGRPGLPRHLRSWGTGPIDESMSWGEAAAWSTLAVTCALAVSRWVAHLAG